MDKKTRNNLLITAGLLLKDHVAKVDKEKAKKALITVGAVGALYAECKITEREKQWRAEMLEKHPGIAFRGEKVIALEDYSLLYDDNIHKGGVYTVHEVCQGGEYYQLKEFRATYNPYLGEYTTPCYPTHIFKKSDSPEEEKT